MKQISGVKEKPFASSLNICPEARDGIFKILSSLGNDSKESIPPAYRLATGYIYVAWRAGTTTIFLS